MASKFAGALVALPPLTKVPLLSATNPVSSDDWTVTPIAVYPNVGDADTYIKAEILGATDSMIIEKKVNGVLTRSDERAYAIDIARYFRLKELSDKLDIEYSTDGVNWTTWTSQTTPFDVSNVEIRYGARSTTPSRTRKAKFENFNILPSIPNPPPPPPDPDPTPPPPTGDFFLPTSRSQVGPRVSRVTDQRNYFPAAEYTGVNFVNTISDLPDGRFVFNDCEVRFGGPTGFNRRSANRTVYMNHCSGFGFFADGAQTNFTADWCLWALAPVAWRPEGSPQYNTSTSTPSTMRSCILSSEGVSPNGAHCEAMQMLGGRDVDFTSCVFSCIDRWGPSIPGENTAPASMLSASCVFTNCLFGPLGVAYYMVYSGGGDPNDFNNCKVGTMGGTQRAIIGTDFYPDVPVGQRPRINGSPAF